MGYLKNKQIEDEERGYSIGSKVFICEKHFDDQDIKKYIVTHGTTKDECAFCNHESDEITSDSLKLNLDVLLGGIVSCINRSYDDPANGLAYESAEGGYIGGNVYETLELLNEVIPLEADYEVIECIAGEIIQTTWTEGEFYGNKYHEELSYLWKRFSGLIRHKVRYLFREIPAKSPEDNINNEPHAILDIIGDFIDKLQLFATAPEQTTLFNQNIIIYRARQHSKIDDVKNCKDISSPPCDKAKPNRFSAEGISMFYGADNKVTAIEEVINRNEPKSYVTIAEFIPARKLTLVDLRNTHNVGFFNFDKIDLYEPSKFLNEFVRQVSTKIDPHQNRTIEFVPSQVVTEYLKHVLPAILNVSIDGIVYKSSQVKGQDCYVIFADDEQCDDKKNANDKTLLIFQKIIETKKVSDL